MDSKAHFIVRGIVQGVGFRYFVYRHAKRLALLGYVRNRPNGEVECVAEGDNDSITELNRLLQEGPSAAHVQEVVVNWGQPTNEFLSFDIKY